MTVGQADLGHAEPSLCGGISRIMAQGDEITGLVIGRGTGFHIDQTDGHPFYCLRVSRFRCNEGLVSLNGRRLTRGLNDIEPGSTMLARGLIFMPLSGADRSSLRKSDTRPPLLE